VREGGVDLATPCSALRLRAIDAEGERHWEMKGSGTAVRSRFPTRACVERVESITGSRPLSGWGCVSRSQEESMDAGEQSGNFRCIVEYSGNLGSLVGTRFFDVFHICFRAVLDMRLRLLPADGAMPYYWL
jgi:hypothetical protein